MLFTSTCQCNNQSIFIPRYFIEFDGYKLFLLSLTFMLLKSTFLADSEITSLVFSTLREILFALNQLFKCFISRLTRVFRFFADLLVWKRFVKDLYHQHSDAPYCI